jgi:hypothetical protein
MAMSRHALTEGKTSGGYAKFSKSRGRMFLSKGLKFAIVP